MRAKLVVFPIKGTNWCFSRSISDSIASSNLGSAFSQTPSTLKELWRNISSKPKPFNANAELLVDFVSLKVLPFSLFPFVRFISNGKDSDFSLFFVVGFFWKRWIELGLVWKKHLKELSRTRFISELSLLIHLFFELGVCYFFFTWLCDIHIGWDWGFCHGLSHLRCSWSLYRRKLQMFK